MVQGGAVSALGDILYSVAIGFWVYERTGSNALMGIMSSISLFMTMFCMPFAGAVIDRCDRKRIIVGMDVLRGLLMLAAGLLAFQDRLTVSITLAVAFLASLCGVFFEPAMSTLLLDLVPHEEMIRGQSAQEGIQTAVSMGGKALSGVLVAVLGVPVLILLNGISYFLSALTELFIRVPETLHQGEKLTPKAVLADLGGAGRMVWKDPFLRLFGFSTLAINVLAAGPMMLKLPFALEKGFSLEQYSLLLTLETGIMLSAALLLGILKLSPKLRYDTMSGGFLCGTIFYLLGYGSDTFSEVCLFLTAGSFFNTLGNSILNAQMMLAVPEENRGSILGLVSAACMGGAALSSVVYGILCDLLPMTAVFLGGAVLAFFPMLHLCLHKRTRSFITGEG